MNLNSQQRAAVDQVGHTVIAAGPGSGKTFTIVQRARSILQRPGTRVAMVTFTKAAAAEMAERMGAHAPNARFHAATFDSYTLRQLTRSGTRIRPINGYVIHGYVRRAMQRCSVVPQGELSQIVAEVEALNRAETIADGDGPYETILHTYLELTAAEGCMDHATIARQVIQSIKAGSIAPLGATHLMVDEFQDTDALQLAWVLEHARRGLEVTIVGDDDQSIYGWRHALGVRGMRAFADATGAALHALETCYRCRSEIVDSAQRLITHSPERMPKRIRSDIGGGGTIDVHQFPDLATEHQRIVQDTVAAYKNGQSTAILARANDLLRPLQARLAECQIPVRMMGTSSLWDSRGARLVFDLVETLVRPEDLRPVTHLLQHIEVSDGAITAFRDFVREQGYAGTPTFRDARTRALYHRVCGWRRLLNCSPRMAVRELQGYLLDQGGGGARTFEIETTAQTITKLLSGFEGDLLAVLRFLRTGASEEDPSERPRTVDLATLHSSKGLEWDRVTITQVNAKWLPHPDSDHHEERRLFYVGMTRARQHLVIATNCQPSRFIEEAGLSITPRIAYPRAG